jgi:hypothetical protein
MVRKTRSAGTYLLLVLATISSILICYPMRINYLLGLRLWKKKSKSTVTRTLLFNALELPPLAVINILIPLTIFCIDRDMHAYEYLSSWCSCLANFFLILSTLSLSLVWIELVQGIGRQNTPIAFRSIHYPIILYGSAIGFTSIAMYFFAVMQSAPFYALFAIIYSLSIALSYFIAGRSISSQIVTVGSTPSRVAAMQSAVQLGNMVTLHLLGIIFFCIVSAITIPTRTPLYAAQNSLPRFTQGQVPIMTVSSFRP